MMQMLLSPQGVPALASQPRTFANALGITLGPNWVLAECRGYDDFPEGRVLAATLEEPVLARLPNNCRIEQCGPQPANREVVDSLRRGLQREPWMGAGVRSWLWRKRLYTKTGQTLTWDIRCYALFDGNAKAQVVFFDLVGLSNQPLLVDLEWQKQMSARKARRAQALGQQPLPSILDNHAEEKISLLAPSPLLTSSDPLALYEEDDPFL